MSAIIEYAAKGQAETEELENELFIMDKENNVSDDLVLINSMPGLLSTGYEELPYPDYNNGEHTWRWQWTEITSGRYPLNKLPDHVRDIAEALYYLKNAPKVKSA